MFLWFSFRYGVWNIHVKRNLSKTYWDVPKQKIQSMSGDWWNSSCLKRKFWPRFSVSYPFQRFIPVSAFYPHFSVLSPIQRFILISMFYPHFSVLSHFTVVSPFQCFIPISALYLHFSVLSPFQRFILISVSVFSFRFQFPFQPFSFSVLSRPQLTVWNDNRRNWGWNLNTRKPFVMVMGRTMLLDMRIFILL